jgi:hypothetical protein
MKTFHVSNKEFQELFECVNDAIKTQRKLVDCLWDIANNGVLMADLFSQLWKIHEKINSIMEDQ